MPLIVSTSKAGDPLAIETITALKKLDVTGAVPGTYKLRFFGYGEYSKGISYLANSVIQGYVLPEAGLPPGDNYNLTIIVNKTTYSIDNIVITTGMTWKQLATEIQTKLRVATSANEIVELTTDDELLFKTALPGVGETIEVSDGTVENKKHFIDVLNSQPQDFTVGFSDPIEGKNGDYRIIFRLADGNERFYSYATAVARNGAYASVSGHADNIVIA